MPNDSPCCNHLWVLKVLGLVGLGLAAATANFSGADCAALIRQAALAAMRRSMQAPTVTAEDVRSALTVVHASLDPAQVAKLRDYAAARASA